jgi:hypothetical protein
MNIVVQMTACCPSCRQQMARELERNIPAMLDKAAEAQRIALQFGTIKCACEEEQYAQSPGRTN